VPPLLGVSRRASFFATLQPFHLLAADLDRQFHEFHLLALASHRRLCSDHDHDHEGHQPALPVLDSHGIGPLARSAGSRPQHSFSPPCPPPHHRVHHGSNPRYIDRNHGGTLIIWDKLFGTFEPENPADPVRFGLTRNIQTYNPVVIAFHEWAEMFRDVWHAPGWRNKLRYVFGNPGWRHDESPLDPAFDNASTF